MASREGFDALAITNHNAVLKDPDVEEYAKQKDLLIIPGMEADFSNKHVLILNPNFDFNPPGRSLKDLEKVKHEDSVLIAPHPYFSGFKSLESDLLDYIHLFDAIEFAQYYNRIINFNKAAVETASKYGKPMVGSSDCHFLWQFGRTYSLVEADKDIPSILAAIKSGKVEVVTRPISILVMARIMTTFFWRKLFFERRKKKGSRRRTIHK